ncbi:hypothetical protein Ddye_014363 [Dipteronia dyeriana]|uniref:DNA-directed DNA polymerase family A palm domain-containing protein n=1 Tax=Dipteronia dyeriana TaxID=168575 RepID=A0AAE0CKH8_9ROSI|nr:hypothetical protein Ddye_014363 [Dipteronia dyeriana]
MGEGVRAGAGVGARALRSGSRNGWGARAGVKKRSKALSYGDGVRVYIVCIRVCVYFYGVRKIVRESVAARELERLGSLSGSRKGNGSKELGNWHGSGRGSESESRSGSYGARVGTEALSGSGSATEASVGVRPGALRCGPGAGGVDSRSESGRRIGGGNRSAESWNRSGVGSRSFKVALFFFTLSKLFFELGTKNGSVELGCLIGSGSTVIGNMSGLGAITKTLSWGTRAREGARAEALILEAGALGSWSGSAEKAGAGAGARVLIGLRYRCSVFSISNGKKGRCKAFENQPALEKDCYKIRQAFIVSPGHSLIVADYGQLELRILAHLADRKSMLDAFKPGGDFHSRTAMNTYPHIREAVEMEKVLLEWHPQPPPRSIIKDAFASERRKAKMLNFSIAYGMTPRGLAEG